MANLAQKKCIQISVSIFISRSTIRFPSAIRRACIFRLVIKFCNVRQQKKRKTRNNKWEKIK